MELRHLRYFVAVAEARNLSAAAELLHIAQPALTQNIKRLEEELDTRLFERSKKGMELTDTGYLFLSHAQTILRQVSNAKRSVHETQHSPSGRVSLAVPASVSHVLTVPLYDTIQKQYPNIELSLQEGLTGDLESRFRQGLTDILLDFDTQETAEFSVEPLLRESLYFIEPRRGYSAETIEFTKLTDYPLYLPRAMVDAMGKAVHRYAQLENLDLQILPGALSMHGMLRLVQSGLGYSVLPWSAIYDLVGQSLNARRIVKPALYRKVCMITDITRPRSSATEKIMEVIRQATVSAYDGDRWHGELLTGR